MEESSRLGLLLAALEAILLRFSRLAGSWAQQSPCGPLAARVQGSPFALVARHEAISGYPPPGPPTEQPPARARPPAPGIRAPAPIPPHSVYARPGLASTSTIRTPFVAPQTSVCTRPLSPVSAQDSPSPLRPVRTVANRDPGRGRSRPVPFVLVFRPQDGARVIEGALKDVLQVLERPLRGRLAVERPSEDLQGLALAVHQPLHRLPQPLAFRTVHANLT